MWQFVITALGGVIARNTRSVAVVGIPGSRNGVPGDTARFKSWDALVDPDAAPRIDGRIARDRTAANLGLRAAALALDSAPFVGRGVPDDLAILDDRVAAVMNAYPAPVIDRPDGLVSGDHAVANRGA